MKGTVSSVFCFNKEQTPLVVAGRNSATVTG